MIELVVDHTSSRIGISFFSQIIVPGVCVCVCVCVCVKMINVRLLGMDFYYYYFF